MILAGVDPGATCLHLALGTKFGVDIATKVKLSDALEWLEACTLVVIEKPQSFGIRDKPHIRRNVARTEATADHLYDLLKGKGVRCLLLSPEKIRKAVTGYDKCHGQAGDESLEWWLRNTWLPTLMPRSVIPALFHPGSVLSNSEKVDSYIALLLAERVQSDKLLQIEFGLVA